MRGLVSQIQANQERFESRSLTFLRVSDSYQFVNVIQEILYLITLDANLASTTLLKLEHKDDFNLESIVRLLQMDETCIDDEKLF